MLPNLCTAYSYHDWFEIQVKSQVISLPCRECAAVHSSTLFSLFCVRKNSYDLLTSTLGNGLKKEGGTHVASSSSPVWVGPPKWQDLHAQFSHCILTGYILTKHGFKRQIKMFMIRLTLGKNLSLLWRVKRVSSQPTFWKVITWHNMVPKDQSKCSWLDSLWEEICHLYDMWKVFHLNQHFERL